MRFLIAYDIADPKRLRRVARFFERRALRVQKSVFRFEGSALELEEAMARAGELVDAGVDRVQAWPMPAGSAAEGVALGNVPDLQPGAVVLAPGVNFSVSRHPSP